jgi:hypothetical protein
VLERDHGPSISPSKQAEAPDRDRANPPKVAFRGIPVLLDGRASKFCRPLSGRGSRAWVVDIGRPAAPTPVLM